MPFATGQLSLADHVHRLNACNEDASASGRLESEHRPHDALYRSVVLLDDVIQILWLTQLDVGPPVSVVTDNRCLVGSAAVNGDLLGLAVQRRSTL